MADVRRRARARRAAAVPRATSTPPTRRCRAPAHAARDTMLIGELAPEGAAERPACRADRRFRRSRSCGRCTASTRATSRCAARRRPRLGLPGRAAAAARSWPPTRRCSRPPASPTTRTRSSSPPEARCPTRTSSPLSDLPRLERRLTRSSRAYGVHRQLPIYLTEYGYETNPPNPFRGVSPATQARVSEPGRVHGLAGPARAGAVPVPARTTRAPDTTFPPGSSATGRRSRPGSSTSVGATSRRSTAYRLPIYIPTSRRSAAAVAARVGDAAAGAERQLAAAPRSSGAARRPVQDVIRRHRARTTDPERAS